MKIKAVCGVRGGVVKLDAEAAELVQEWGCGLSRSGAEIALAFVETAVLEKLERLRENAGVEARS